MDNDKDDTNIIPFKRKTVMMETMPVAAVYVKDGLVGLEIKDGGLFLTPAGALDLCLAISCAIRAIHDSTKDE